MKHLTRHVVLFGALCFAATWTAFAAEKPAAAAPLATEQSTDRSEVDALEGPTDLQILLRDFRLQRAEFILAREQLRRQLAAATTEEERRAVFRAYAELNRERMREQAELRRDLKRRQMEIRRNRRLRGGDEG